MNKTGITNIILLGMLSVASVSCGKISQSSTVSEQSARYYAQFYTSSNGMSAGADLKAQCGTISSYASNCNTGNIKLQIDSSGMYRLYSDQPYLSSNPNGTIANGASGSWSFSNNTMVFNELGSTVNYNIQQNNSQNFNQNNFNQNNFNQNNSFSSNNCLTIKINKDINFNQPNSYNNFNQIVNSNIKAGTTLNFCK